MRLPDTLLSEINPRKRTREEKRQVSRKIPMVSNNVSRHKSQLSKLEMNNPNFYKLLQESKLIEDSEKPNEITIDELNARRYSKNLKLKNGREMFKKDGLDFILDLVEKPKDTKEESSDESDENGGDVNIEAETEQNTTYYTPEVIIPKKETGTYIPPHLRVTNENEAYKRLSSQIQGLLNRVTEANIESIFKTLENLYLVNPRHNMNELISNQILDAVKNTGNLIDNYILNYAALVALIYHSINTELGSMLLDKTINLFDSFRLSDTKICSNLTSLICYLFNFNVISVVFVMQFINECVERMEELDVELILKVIKTSGSLIRAENPTTLKDFITLIQEKDINSKTLKPEISNGSRYKFMLEQIYNLKNNKSTKKFNFDGVQTLEIMESLRKFVRNTVKKNGGINAEPVRCSLEDIRNIETRGKWWIVGAAWVGNQFKADDKPSNTTGQMSNSTGIKEDDQITRIAKKMNINTDIRRSIFQVLMTSDDYVDAFDRLSKLRLKDKQEREIIKMLIYCVTKEKAYNPFYATLAEKLCQSSHNHRMTLQFALWDFIKSLPSNSPPIHIRVLLNTGKFYGALFSAGILSLSVLKIIDFDPILVQTHRSISADRTLTESSTKMIQPSLTCLFLQVILLTLFLNVVKDLGGVETESLNSLKRSIKVEHSTIYKIFGRLKFSMNIKSNIPKKGKNMESDDDLDERKTKSKNDRIETEESIAKLEALKNGLNIVLLHWIKKRIPSNLDKMSRDSEVTAMIKQLAEERGLDVSDQGMEKIHNFIRTNVKVAREAIMSSSG